MLVGYALTKLARFSCNGDNGSPKRAPCTGNEELPCPYCVARQLLKDPRTFVPSGKTR